MVCVPRGAGHPTCLVAVDGQETLALWLGDRSLPTGRTLEAFRAAVTAQVVKDFRWDPEKVAQARVPLLQLLIDEISWGMERDATALFACFYRLDLGESVIRSVLDAHERPEAVERLAQRSLERAAQKVWLRWTFGARDSAG